ncbi:MAG TPA: RidA family protein [Geminicoccaceae bacterium]
MIRSRLKALGLELPKVQAPAFQYVPVAVHGGVAYVSGQLPWVKGEITTPGKVDGEVTVEQAQEAARLCTLQALAWLDQTLDGLDRVERVLKVTGFVASSPNFVGQPTVIDGASKLLVELFGQAGQHARSAIGVAELPRNTPVEIEFVVAIKRRPQGQHQRRLMPAAAVEKR